LIIAFDTSVKRTGYVREVPGGRVRFGSFGMREGVGANLGRLQSEWAERAWPLIEGCTAVYYEAPIISAHMNATVLRQLWAITSHLEFLAFHAGAQCVPIVNGAHKKLIYDHGGSKPENATEYAAAWGLRARNPDEADAFGVYLYALREDFPARFKPWLTIRKQAAPVGRIAKPKKPGKGKAGEKRKPRPRKGEPQQPGLL
jgi:hypothetical protein